MSAASEIASSSSGSTAPSERRGRRSTNGASLIASGQPMVFLTGGALICCLAMIAGLLGLVVYMGSTTFWPVPVVEVELLDGTRLLGEVTRSEPYTLSQQRVGDDVGILADAAREYLGQAESRQGQRRLVRTGNFELTQTHFHWVSDHELTPAAQTEPEWAMVVERVEWGRLYGVPKAYVIVEPRAPSLEELELTQMQNFFAQGMSSLPESLSAVDSTPIQTQLDAIRLRNSADFVAESLNREAQQREYELTDGTLVSQSALQDNQIAKSVRYAWAGEQSAWEKFQESHDDILSRRTKKNALEKVELGMLNRTMEQARLQLRSLEIRSGRKFLDSALEWVSLEDQKRAIEAETKNDTKVVESIAERFPALLELQSAASEILATRRRDAEEQLAGLTEQMNAIRVVLDSLPADIQPQLEEFWIAHRQNARQRSEIQALIARLTDANSRQSLHFVTTSSPDFECRVADIVRAYPANRLTLRNRWSVYLSRWWEFVSDEPREANSEGGVFPAIWGTVVMTVVMSMAVVPFGVLAALYLREYARGGIVVSVIRIALNNLAGVPSIVFGVFGFGFFCYFLGAYVDGGPRNMGVPAWPVRSWWLGVLGLTITGALAFVTGIMSMTRPGTPGSRRQQWMQSLAFTLWILTAIILLLLVFVTPFFDGFYQSKLPNPTFGKGGLIWSALTLSLMTLPVVIVSTEEALSAVPNSMREGSYACGAGKWQTILRIVLPQAMPGIMTGMILAMARGAGEVAPLMLVGAVKLVPELPVDSQFPYVHLERSFMHLGFHIYDLGFQSPNSEAAKPIVFTTTLLLILLIATLNMSAIWLRARLRRRFRSQQF